MEKIKIITDSCLDIPEELIQKNDIEVMPVLINFGEETYLDREEIDINKMQEKIDKEGILPTTAQITPARFEEKFREYLDQGYRIVAVFFVFRYEWNI